MGGEAQWVTELRSEIKVRLRRQRATQAGLASHLGITEKHVSQLLSGKVTGSPAMLEQLASAVGLRITIVAAAGEPPLIAGRRSRIRELEALLAEREQRAGDQPC